MVLEGISDGRTGEVKFGSGSHNVSYTAPKKAKEPTSHESSYNRASASTSMPSSGIRTRRSFVFRKGCTVLGVGEFMEVLV